MAVVKEGYIEKAGPTMFTPFRRRYLVLYTTKVLEYFTDETKREFLGQIVLDHSCRVDTAERGKNFNYGFKVFTPARHWHFAVEEVPDRQQWVKSIKDVMNGKLPQRQKRNKSAPAVDVSGLQIPSSYRKERASQDVVEEKELDQRRRPKEDSDSKWSTVDEGGGDNVRAHANTIDIVSQASTIPSATSDAHLGVVGRELSDTLITMNTMNELRQLPRDTQLSIISFLSDEWKEMSKIPVLCKWLHVLCLHPIFYSKYEVIPRFLSAIARFDPDHILQKQFIISHYHKQIWTFGNMLQHQLTFLEATTPERLANAMESSPEPMVTEFPRSGPSAPINSNMLSLLQRTRRWGFDNLDLWKNITDDERLELSKFVNTHKESMIEVRIRTQVPNPAIPFRFFQSGIGLLHTRSVICEFSWHANLMKNMFRLGGQKDLTSSGAGSNLLKLALYRVNLYDDISLQHDTTFQACMPGAVNLLVLSLVDCRWNGKLSLPSRIEILKFAPTDKSVIDLNGFIHHSTVPSLHLLVDHKYWPKVLKKKIIGGSKALGNGRLSAWATNYGSKQSGQHYKNVNFCTSVPDFESFQDCNRFESLAYLDEHVDMSEFWCSDRQPLQLF